MSGLIRVMKRDVLLAIIVRDDYKCDGVDFLTSEELSQQVAVMHHLQGKVIDAHIHNVVHRNVVMTQEVLFIKKGKLRVDFYDDYKDYIESYILGAGDTILLISGGHGFKVLEEIEMIEVKQGPYSGDNDKSRFEGVYDDKVKMIREVADSDGI
jgi:mannose-6-phosphate isomerase-like protein (cupin superfamily)